MAKKPAAAKPAARKAAPKKPGPPPFKWTAAIEQEILDRIAKGQAVVDICADSGLPSQTTFYKRLQDDEVFAKRYAHARELQADTIFDEILQIADDGRNDWMERRGEEDTGWVANGEHIQRSKLRIEARKWMAGKLRPKVYGDKLDVEHKGGITVVLESDAERL